MLALLRVQCSHTNMQYSVLHINHIGCLHVCVCGGGDISGSELRKDLCPSASPAPPRLPNGRKFNSWVICLMLGLCLASGLCLPDSWGRNVCHVIVALGLRPAGSARQEPLAPRVALNLVSLSPCCIISYVVNAYTLRLFGSNHGMP